ncbi:ABC transporter ATP-binding protein [Variovorax guangxiensis]|uniref:ABC transporter ATP-binding protein n=1 Tax=Variovorax guangxiensis TaxID=1775474 RepID=UPI00286415ED|nr:ABC transporter ATP-binding protein [Variovorax guangxiensis]MDR6858667.1 branched-chain amino acid transport system ATP-binding protein [Variovorax guangxiensis]
MLKVDRLEAGYGSGKVLFGVNFQVPKGEVTAIIGRNGVGKTTTLKTVMGIVQASSGTVSLDGLDLSRKPAHEVVRAGIGYVPEGRQIFPALTVLENLRVGQRSKPKTWTEERVLDLFPNLQRRIKNAGHALSGGEQQMLAIARALVTDVKVLMLDEPTQGLAPMVVQQIGDVVKLLRSEGVAVLLVEQNLNLTERISDRILVMSKGKVVETLSIADFKADAERVHRQWLTI